MGDPRNYVHQKKDTPNQMPKKMRIYSALQQYSGKFNHQLNFIKNLQKFKNVVLLPWYFLEIVGDFFGCFLVHIQHATQSVYFVR